MSTDWVTSAFSKNSTVIEIDEELLDEEVVILLTGKNKFGDQIFSYLKLTLRRLQDLKVALKEKQDFMPAEFGTVLAAGRDEPSAELRSEMAITYNMIDKPKPVEVRNKEKPKMASFAVKDVGNFWDDK
ncbi:MAG: hypothetical protein MRY32_00015 [Rickettsiales bacterium]|nr:hypothetical protein [Rickettsiales bacterium]